MNRMSRFLTFLNITLSSVVREVFGVSLIIRSIESIEIPDSIDFSIFCHAFNEVRILSMARQRVIGAITTLFLISIFPTLYGLNPRERIPRCFRRG
jgi:hypothetical protein